MLKREIYTTADGSKTIYLPEWTEHYHSKHGALQESLYVFIKMGMDVAIPLSRKREPQNPVCNILEYGLGTGLNALLAAQVTPDDVHVNYTSLEAYPLTQEEWQAMDYGALTESPALYEQIHQVAWEKEVAITTNFTLHKKQADFTTVNALETYDVAFYDAFGPRVQPELWTVEIFEAAYKALKSGGILVTYCAAGFVRRNMIAAGFDVEKLPGPPGKREMLRAIKR